MKVLYKDVVVIGSGLAGLYTALSIDKQFEVGIVSKDKFDKSNSVLAQGGIASCISKEDSFDHHVKDTMIAGSYANDIDAVSMLVSKAPGEIHKLIEMGVEFDKDDEGMVLTTLEGGHSYRRVLHANGDATGKAIMETVVSQSLNRSNIEIYEETMALDLIKNEKTKDFSVIVLSGDEYICIRTQSIVIATGGVGGIYKNTTNQMFSTGDGIALAKGIGANLVDMCYIQFHPTAYFGQTLNQRFLITEAIRGEGAILKNHLNESFMESYDDRKDLAPRDIVARSIFTEMGKHNKEHVWLDSTQHDSDFLKERFPTVYDFLSEQGIYMEKDFIPVAPVEHYFVGGIEADLYSRTNVEGVYACGEVSSTGVHGANRLASNSLLECVVFGKRCGIHINKTLVKQNESIKDKKVDSTWDHIYNKSLCAEESISVCDFSELKDEIRLIMSEHVGIIRKDSDLIMAKERVVEILKTVEEHQKVCSMFYELKNMCIVAIEIIEDALIKESRGCHYKVGEEVV